MTGIAEDWKTSLLSPAYCSEGSRQTWLLIHFSFASVFPTWSDPVVAHRLRAIPCLSRTIAYLDYHARCEGVGSSWLPYRPHALRVFISALVTQRPLGQVLKRLYAANVSIDVVDVSTEPAAQALLAGAGKILRLRRAIRVMPDRRVLAITEEHLTVAALERNGWSKPDGM